MSTYKNIDLIYNITVFLGDDYTDTFKGYTITGNPTNSLASIKIKYKEKKDSTDYIKSIENGDGITINDAAAWNYTIDKFNVDRTLWSVQTYYYDVETTDSAGNIKTYTNGKFTVEQDVTD